MDGLGSVHTSSPVHKGMCRWIHTDDVSCRSRDAGLTLLSSHNTPLPRPTSHIFLSSCLSLTLHRGNSAMNHLTLMLKLCFSSSDPTSQIAGIYVSAQREVKCFYKAPGPVLQWSSLRRVYCRKDGIIKWPEDKVRFMMESVCRTCNNFLEELKALRNFSGSFLAVIVENGFVLTKFILTVPFEHSTD